MAPIGFGVPAAQQVAEVALHRPGLPPQLQPEMVPPQLSLTVPLRLQRLPQAGVQQTSVAGTVLQQVGVLVPLPQLVPLEQFAAVQVVAPPQTVPPHCVPHELLQHTPPLLT